MEWPLTDLLSNWNPGPGNGSSVIPPQHYLGVCRYVREFSFVRLLFCVAQEYPGLRSPKRPCEMEWRRCLRPFMGAVRSGYRSTVDRVLYRNVFVVNFFKNLVTLVALKLAG